MQRSERYTSHVPFLSCSCLLLIPFFCAHTFNFLAKNIAGPSSPQSHLDLITILQNVVRLSSVEAVRLNVTINRGGLATLRNSAKFRKRESHDVNRSVPPLCFTPTLSTATFCYSIVIMRTDGHLGPGQLGRSVSRSENRIPVGEGGAIFRTRPERHCGPPTFLYNGYRVSFPGGKVDVAWR
jgi:hypothetical protein